MPLPPLNWVLPVAAVMALSACRHEPSAPSGAVPPTQPPPAESSARPAVAPEALAQLRTGEVALEELPTKTVALVQQFEDEQAWYAKFALDVPENTRPIDGAFRSRAGVASEQPRADGGLDVIVRIPKGAPREVGGWLYVHTEENTPQRIPVIATAVPPPPRASELPSQWHTWLAQRFSRESSQAHPWHTFASARLTSMVSKRSSQPATPPPHTEWSDLMATTTGAMALQQALQTNRGLNLDPKQGPAKIPFSTLTGPTLTDHPFQAMSSALPGPRTQPVEALAQATPADFWYFRVRAMGDLLRALDELSDWGEGIPHVIAGQSYGEDLLARYRTQLGLPGTNLGDTFGPALVRELAVVGSDPYVREGTDITLIFEAIDARVFELALQAERRVLESSHGRIDRRTVAHQRHTIEIHENAEGTVRQHVAIVGSRIVVSNSLGATTKVLDAIDGRVPALSSQPDFAYMLARDPTPSAALAFLGDRFIAAVVGPEQKIKALRRQLALSELLVPGFAAVLYGYLQGTPPADTATLIRSGLLATRELRHRDGAAIAFTPGQAPRSRWGSPNGLTPLIDLPTPTTVTPQERDAYGEFANAYTADWQTFIDPIAVRLNFEGDGTTMELRMLPLLMQGPIVDISSVVGDTKVEVPGLPSGVQAALAVDPRAPLRRELDRFAEQSFGERNLGLGWLGDWVVLGSLDRASITFLHQLVEPNIQRPATRQPHETEFIRHIAALPLYAVADVKHPTTLIATLAAFRALADNVAPGQIEWKEFARHGDVPIVRVGLDPRADPSMGHFSTLAVYYAMIPGAWILALQPDVLGTILDRFDAGERPAASANATMQATFEASWHLGSPIFTSLGWTLQAAANLLSQRSLPIAEVLLHADPAAQDPEVFKQTALAYFGAVPLTASGRYDFELDHGLAKDPIHGTAVAPIYPALPVPGSPVQQLIQRLEGIRADVALDTEPGPLDPPARSLHTRVHLNLHKP